jgi:uncharacterized protein (DUF427 family)
MTSPARGQARTEVSNKRVRTYLDGQLVADSRQPVLVWEHPYYYPTYYFPAADVHAKLQPTGATQHDADLGEATVYDMQTDGATAQAAAVRYHHSPVRQLRDLVRIQWPSMSQWLEEDEPVYVHPRDPYKRVDVLASSRHVVVGIDGVTVADSRQPRILFETGLPPRYYLPITDARMELLRPSTHTTQCPYKGTATYWNVVTGDTEVENIAWCYRAPVAESQKIAGLVCFYDERVDVYVDGQLQERPVTPFS